MSIHPEEDQNSRPLHRLAGHARILAGLAAIYGPVVLALMTHRMILGKVYVVVGLWATEGIVWYWHQIWVENRRNRHLGAWTTER
jgi:hypothetical protein